MLAPALAAAARGLPRHARRTGAVSIRRPRRCWSSSARTAQPALDAAEARAAALLAGANLVQPLEFTRDEDQIELYWQVREACSASSASSAPKAPR